MRDHTKFDVFRLADSLAIAVYHATKHFPEDERYGLASQLRRAAVSIGANIVEGSARRSQADFLRLLVVAYASACELEYELSLAKRLGYMTNATSRELCSLASRTCRALASFIRAIESERT